MLKLTKIINMDADPSNTESGMSQSGPRNFFCHQCNSRTRVSIEVSTLKSPSCLQFKQFSRIIVSHDS